MCWNIHIIPNLEYILCFNMTRIILLLSAAFITYVHGQSWTPPQQAKLYLPGAPTYLFTRGDKSYREVWYTVQDRAQFVFKVKACAEAYVALSSNTQVTTDFSIEIALGVAENNRSQIKYVSKDRALFEISTPRILHCNEQRTFWIRWRNNFIEVGRGPLVGEQTFMNIQDVESHRVNAIGLTSALGNSAQWEVKENSGDQIFLYTSIDYKYQGMWKSIEGRNFWTFSVMAEGHVHVVLAEGLGLTSANVIEFVIGGWQGNRTVIRTRLYGNTNGEIKTQTYTNGILSKNEYRNFWIGWMNSTVEVGQGTVYGRNRILRWRENTMNPRYMGVTTGFGVDGYWLIQDDQESMNYIYTKGGSGSHNKTWIESPRKQFVTFQVQVCKEATILLSSSKNAIPGESIEVVIGSSDNTKSLFRYYGQDPFAEGNTTNVLNCDETKHFWLSWNNNIIRLGLWHVYDQNVILEKEMSTPFNIRALSLVTPTDDGLWMIRDSFGERIDIYTPSTPDFNDFDQIWRTVTLRDYILFQVKACSDAHVGVSPTPSVEKEDVYYDVVISGFHNSITKIVKVVNGERSDASKPKNTKNLLDCDQVRDFWISWTDNVVKLGRGAIPTHHVLLTQPVKDIFPIKAVSFSTGYGYYGNWYLENDNGDYMMYYTNSVVNKNVLGLNKDIGWVSLKVRACRDSSVFLSSAEGGDALEVVLGTEANQKSLIRVEGTEVARASTPDLLSCLDEIYIWVSWEDGQLTVGRGTLVGTDMFLQYTHSSVFDRIHFYSTADMLDLNCRWKIFYNTGLWTSFETPTQYGYHFVWESVEHRQGLVFSVRACKDVHVILSDVIRFLDRKYEIVIGSSGNTRSAIRMFNEREYTVVVTEGITSCVEDRAFWITWMYGAIEVGRGEIIGQERFMDFRPLEFYPIRAVGFSSGNEFNATWSVKLLDELLATLPPATEDPGIEGPNRSGLRLSSGAMAGVIIGVLAAVVLVGLMLVHKFKGNIAFAYSLFSNKEGLVNQSETPSQVDAHESDKECVET